MNESSFNIDDLINGVFAPKSTLTDLYERRLEELKITHSNAADITGIDPRALLNIVTGAKKIADFTNLIKLASFLQISKVQVVQLYVDLLEKNFPAQVPIAAEKVNFIKENFDLASLRKAGFINSITDFREIETKLTNFLGLKNILDYEAPDDEVAFSSGALAPRNPLNRKQWVAFARATIEEINNPYEYNRKALIEYFSQIRWHSTNVELGLVNVIRELSKMGITVIYQEPLPALHLRGATIPVNDRPGIVITDYKGFYPTLWFALVHELFHVLFDWQEIRNSSYHVSDEEEQELSVKAKEEEADNFAREYLFSIEKTNQIRPLLKGPSDYVAKFAKLNHVHESFPYVFHAHDVGKKNRSAWALAVQMNPDIDCLLRQIKNSWDDPVSIAQHAKMLAHKHHNL